MFIFVRNTNHLMSITSLKTRFARIITEIAEQRQKLAEIYANELISRITDRLLNEGEDANGKKFPLYSENNLSVKTAQALVNSSNRSSAKLKKGETSYKDIRRLLGLPVDKRTHSFTNDMIKSIRPIVEEHNQYMTIIEISAKDAPNQKKLNENSKRMKTNLLRANKKERELIESLNQKRVQNIINK